MFGTDFHHQHSKLQMNAFSIFECSTTSNNDQYVPSPSNKKCTEFNSIYMQLCYNFSTKNYDSDGFAFDCFGICQYLRSSFIFGQCIAILCPLNTVMDLRCSGMLLKNESVLVFHWHMFIYSLQQNKNVSHRRLVQKYKCWFSAN